MSPRGTEDARMPFITERWLLYDCMAVAGGERFGRRGGVARGCGWVAVWWR